MSIETFAAFFAVLVSLLGVFIAWKKAPAEVRQLNGSAANSISEAAKTLVEPLMKRVDDLEADLADACEKYDALQEKYDQLEEQYRELKRENDMLDDWARRLAYQVQSMGAAPVTKRLK